MQVYAFILLFLFWLLYFSKLFVQIVRRGRTWYLTGGDHGQGLVLATYVFGVLAACYSILTDWYWRMPIGENAISCVRVAGLVFATLGAVLFMVAMFTMGDSWRVGIPQQENMGELVQVGVYRWSRNPAYVGADGLHIGFAVAFLNPFTVLSAIAVGIATHRQILREEQILRQTFGEKYALYCRSVARYFGRLNTI